MTKRLVILASAGLLAATSGAATADDLLASAAVCAERLRAAEAPAEPAGGSGVARLADVCADLAAELDGEVWGEALVYTRAENLSARSFAELVELIEHYEQARSDTSGLRIGELARIVESLGSLDPAAELSPWETIVSFVRQRLGLDESGDASRLLSWLRRVAIPGAWQRGIVVVLGLLALTVLVAAAAHELAARRARAARGCGGSEAAPHEPLLTIDDIARASPAKQPALLLGLLLARLRARFGDAVRDSMTPRELAARVGALGLSHRGDFEVVAAAAERVTFAGWHPQPGDAAAVLARARAVLDELDRATD